MKNKVCRIGRLVRPCLGGCVTWLQRKSLLVVVAVANPSVIQI